MNGRTLRLLSAAVGLLVAGAAYLISSEKVPVLGCNITEIRPADADGCSVACGVAEGRGGDVVCFETGSACLSAPELRERDGLCHEKNLRVFIGPPWDHTGVVVLLSLLSAVCLIAAGVGCAWKPAEGSLE